MFGRDKAELKSVDQIRAMRRAGLVVAQAHAAVREAMEPGVTTAHLDAVAARVISDAGATSSFLGYHGYPRNAAQVVELDDILAARDGGLDAVVELTADRGELLARLQRRAETEGRDDDTAEVIARRLDLYDQVTEPLTTAYAERGLLVRVDGIGPVDEVTERLLSALHARV